MTSDRADRNQSTLMMTITIAGASVQEAIDLEREVLREEGQRGRAVRWVLEGWNLFFVLQFTQSSRRMKEVHC